MLLVFMARRFNLMPFPFHQFVPTSSPKKFNPEERLRRYVELKYGRLNVQKKSKDKKRKKKT